MKTKIRNVAQTMSMVGAFGLIGAIGFSAGCAGDDSATQPSGGSKAGAGGSAASSGSGSGAAGSGTGGSAASGGTGNTGTGGTGGTGQGGTGQAGTGQGGTGQGGTGQGGTGQGGIGGAAGAGGGTNCGPEVCNGLDDDCDGVVDNDNPGAGEVCSVPGAFGVCADGLTACGGGTITCEQQVQPSAETCDGLDNNCNGVPDDDPTDVGNSCDTGLLGICSTGTDECQSGAIVCVQSYTPVQEVCNATDDDCDGTIDNGVGGGDPCVVDGQLAGTLCAQGQTSCTDQGQLACQQTYNAIVETCNGIDDDCNGQTDEGLSGTVCETGEQGVCSAGKLQCSSGVGTCIPDVAPGTVTETCDTLDNNCDGQVDNMSASQLEQDCTARYNNAGNVASWSCSVDGACEIVSCADGWFDCNGLASDGCEANTTNDPSNCGACKTTCNSTNGVPTCVNSACGIECNTGYGNCDGVLTNGCEATLNSSLGNCGACGNACTNPNGSTACIGGACQPNCDPGFGNCDTNGPNGCEAILATDEANCGACGETCQTGTGTTSNSCVNSACSPVCASTHRNCDGDPNNGCETNINADTGNCGGCGQVCGGANAAPSCVNGACILNCNSGWEDCDGDPSNGCEKRTSGTDTQNCGGCGVVCPGTCTAGTCNAVCSSNNLRDCDNNAFTGAGGCEVDVSSDVNNCGNCGTVCTNPGGSTSCVNGQCVPICNSGRADCDGNKVNGCEVNTSADKNNCGACDAQCLEPAGTTQSCTNGSCSPTCQAPAANCDGNNQNGCETNTQSSVSNCGSCGKVCTNANGSTSCTSGNCTPTCGTGYASCDGNPDNGCETHLASNVDNCGACGTDCNTPLPSGAASAQCLSGSCDVASCASGKYDQNGTFSDGCECTTDTGANTCSGATSLGTVAIDGAGTRQGTLVPDGDEDWYVLTFTASNTCSFGPRVWLTGAAANTFIRVYTGGCSTGHSCVLGTSTVNSSGVNMKDYKFTFAGGGCGDQQPNDPTPVSGSFIGSYTGSSGNVLRVRVFSTVTDGTCKAYTLNWSN